MRKVFSGYTSLKFPNFFVFGTILLLSSPTVWGQDPTPPFREEINQPPGTPAKQTAPPVGVVRNGFQSIQVNVDALGNNIIGDAANQPSIAIDPTDPNKIVIGWRQFDTQASDFRQAGWAYSQDGGNKWSFPGVINPGEFRTEAVLDSDAEGNFYYLSIQVFNNRRRCNLFISRDGGKSWTGPNFVYGEHVPWFVIDKRRGMEKILLYQKASNARFYPNTFSRSLDGGIHWTEPSLIPDTPGWGTVAVGPDGEVYVSGETPPFRELVVSKSEDAKDPNVATPTFTTTPVDLDGKIAFLGVPNPGGVHGIMWVAVNHSPGENRGHVYTLCSTRKPPISRDPMDVQFSRSTDGGQTWSPPTRVNDDLNEDAYQMVWNHVRCSKRPH